MQWFILIGPMFCAISLCACMTIRCPLIKYKSKGAVKPIPRHDKKTNPSSCEDNISDYEYQDSEEDENQYHINKSKLNKVHPKNPRNLKISGLYKGQENNQTEITTIRKIPDNLKITRAREMGSTKLSVFSNDL